MRRTVATANVTKVHYPINIALNYNPMYSSIGCNPTYSLFTYATSRCCKNDQQRKLCFEGNYPLFLDGGDPYTTATCILDGGNPTQNSNIILVGGNP